MRDSSPGGRTRRRTRSASPIAAIVWPRVGSRGWTTPPCTRVCRSTKRRTRWSCRTLDSTACTSPTVRRWPRSPTCWARKGKRRSCANGRRYSASVWRRSGTRARASTRIVAPTPASCRGACHRRSSIRCWPGPPIRVVRSACWTSTSTTRTSSGGTGSCQPSPATTRHSRDSATGRAPSGRPPTSSPI